LVIVHRADGVDSARTLARISTLVAHASQVGGTVRVDDALRSAIRRSTEHARLARTHRTGVDDSTLRVSTTGRWHARVLIDRCHDFGF